MHRYRQFENLVLDCWGKFEVVVSKQRHPHIEVGCIDRGVRGSVVGTGGDRGPSVGLGMAPGPISERSTMPGGGGGAEGGVG